MIAVIQEALMLLNILRIEERAQEQEVQHNQYMLNVLFMTHILGRRR